MEMKTGGTPGGIDTRSGKKSVPLIPTPARAIVDTAKDQDFTDKGTVAPKLYLGFASAQEYVASMNADKKDKMAPLDTIAIQPLGLVPS
jgi:hypothetical protein